MWLSFPLRFLSGLIIDIYLILMPKGGTKTNSNGTQLIRPKVDNRENNAVKAKKKTELKQERIPVRGGVKIGDNTDSDKWRCRTCKHLNGIEFD